MSRSVIYLALNPMFTIFSPVLAVKEKSSFHFNQYEQLSILNFKDLLID